MNAGDAFFLGGFLATVFWAWTLTIYTLGKERVF